MTTRAAEPAGHTPQRRHGPLMGTVVMRRSRLQALAVLAVGATLGYAAANYDLNPLRKATAAPSGGVVTAAPAACPTGGYCDGLDAAKVRAAIDDHNAKVSAVAQKNGKKPNILYIMGDDVGWFNIGAYHQGIMSGKTPNLDKLAAQGMRFTDYYAEASCTAGRANFITGEIPLRTGLTTVGQAGADVGLPAQACTLATALKAQGYATGQFGKNHLGDLNKFLPTLHGFDEFFGYLYHLDAMSDPYWYSITRRTRSSGQQVRPAQPGPLLCDRQDDPTVPALGQGRQAEDRRRRPAAAVPGHVERAQHARPAG